MPETATFSAVVDATLQRSQRRDRIHDIVAYARATIRECQVLAFFEQDLIEDQLNVNVLPFLWTRPINLRTILAAAPNEIFGRRRRKLWFANKPPGQVIRDEPYYLYLSGNSFVFTGDELATGDTIDVAYFTYSRKFIYYAEGARPATYDEETQTWSYLPAYDIDATTRQNAEDLVTNWLTFYWYDLILEGTMAKLLKVIGDQRSGSTFALYKQMQKDLLSGERVIYLKEHDQNG